MNLTFKLYYESIKKINSNKFGMILQCICESLMYKTTIRDEFVKAYEGDKESLESVSKSIWDLHKDQDYKDILAMMMSLHKGDRVGENFITCIENLKCHSKKENLKK